MPPAYRDDRESLLARHEDLSAQLEAVRSRTREFNALQQDEARIQAEMDAVRRQLEGKGGRRALPLLERVGVASPCTASWDDMIGDERVRFCGLCAKNVYNLSGMLGEEAERLLQETAGEEMCVRLYRRADGTVLTADCPEGARRVRRRRAAVAAVAGGIAGALLASSTPGAPALTLGSLPDIAAHVALPSAPTPAPSFAAPPPSFEDRREDRILMGVRELPRLPGRARRGER